LEPRTFEKAAPDIQWRFSPVMQWRHTLNRGSFVNNIGSSASGVLLAVSKARPDI
jgi:hypothetical protein